MLFNMKIMEYERYIGYTARIYSQESVFIDKVAVDHKKNDAGDVYVSECYGKCCALDHEVMASVCLHSR